jgi:hypothetical protein
MYRQFLQKYKKNNKKKIHKILWNKYSNSRVKNKSDKLDNQSN